MISPKFKEEYEKLNQKQKEAVDTIEGPVMVIAGPGTGKTTILTLRIANILKQTDTPASGILALTFTEAGVRTMKAKLREIIGDRALEVPIHTFHGFASSVINEFKEHFPHLSKSKQITDIEAEILLRKILSDKKFSRLRPLGEPDFYISKILGTISDAKGEAWTPEMLVEFAKSEIERIKEDPDSISSRGATKGSLKGEALKRIEKCEKTILFGEVYKIYEEKKREERKIDFDDLLFELLKTLREDELLLQILQEKYLYILIDEHQDTNDTQNLIIKMIADFFETPNLFVVGDEKQAIYRFQGASVENFLSFQKIWGQMKVISLEDNYRSHQNILDASFKMIEQNYGEGEHQNLRIKLKSNKTGAPLNLISAPNTETEENFLVERLKELTLKEKDKTVAVIVRKNSDVSKVLSLLESNDIKASAERGTNIFAHPLGSLFFSLIEFLPDSSKTEALAETIALGLWDLDFEKQSGLIKSVRSGDLSKVTKELPVISKLQKEINSSGVLEYLTLAADVSGFTKMASQNPLSIEVWRMIYELARDLAYANNIEDPRKIIEVLLSYKKSSEKKTVKIKTGETFSQITVMTAHSSKGLEFDYVFLPYAVEESWVTKSRGSSFILPREKEDEDDIRDERRLFYVAMTRAREQVTLSFALEDGQGRLLTPVRFINELDDSQISKTSLAKTKTPKNIQTLDKKKSKQLDEKLDYTKRVLLENGLSVTALNHFLNCPSEFYYKSILKVPEPPSASSEKGNAMHEALSRVWTLDKKDEKTISETIIKSVEEYFKKSLLVAFEKEMILEELRVNAPKVASALLEHFSQNGNVTTEGWVETYFKHKDIELKIHGKLDTLIEFEKEILVFDYKTREAKSVAAIKGETKEESGDYFRQLIFYKILLENNPRYAGKKIEPSLVFVKPDSKGRCPTINIPIEKGDEERVKEGIASLIESVWFGDFLNSVCDNKSCKHCALKKVSFGE